MSTPPDLEGLDPSDPLFDDIVFGLPGFKTTRGIVDSNLPRAAVVSLQVVFYLMLAFVLIYLLSHWIFHTWSFVSIFRLGFQRQLEAPDSLSYKLMPLCSVIIFLIYTTYMAGFVYVTVVFLDYRKYFRGFLNIVSPEQQRIVASFLWVFYAMAIFPVIINMVAATIKLAKDRIYTTKALKNFKRIREQQEEERAEKPGTLSRYPENAAVLTMPREKLPLVHIFVPVYNEPLPNLVGAINGITGSDYPSLEVYIGFDNYDIQETFFTLCRILTGVPLVNESFSEQDDIDIEIFVEPSQQNEHGNTNNRNSTVSHRRISVTPSNTNSMTNINGQSGRKPQKYNGFDQIVGDSPKLSKFSLNNSNSDLYHGEHGTSIAMQRLRANSLDFDRENCPDRYEVVYRNVKFTLFRFEHGGKLATQRKMFEQLNDSLLNTGGEQPYVLFMDSDTAIMPDTVSQLVAELHRYPQSSACTGFVVSRNENSYSFWRILQDAEYIESMIFRNAESIMGTVTCLPGVLTMFKYPILIEVAKDYFYQKDIDSTFDFCRRYLGEDRYLTHILMERSGTYTLGFNSKAMCKTEAPDNFYNLLRQRRRWFLGTITNELIMLCTPLFWSKFPMLMLTKLMQILKVGGAVTYLLVIEIIFNLIFDFANFDWHFTLWLFAIIVPNWLFVTVWSILEKRLKGSLIFPVYYWFSPFFMVAVLMYSFATVNERTWGGPRAAADKDEEVSLEADDIQSVTDKVT